MTGVAQSLEVIEVSYLDVAGARAFALGYLDVVCNVPFNYEAASREPGDDESTCEDGWGYERGRAVALYAKMNDRRIPPLYLGTGRSRRLNPRVFVLMGMMVHEGLWL